MVTRTRAKNSHFQEVIELREQEISYKDISAQLDIGSGTINRIVEANNKDHSDLTSFYNATAQKNGHDNFRDYQDSLARNEGFLKTRHKYRYKETYNGRKKEFQDFIGFERGLGGWRQYNKEFKNESEICKRKLDITAPQRFRQTRFEYEIQIESPDKLDTLTDEYETPDFEMLDRLPNALQSLTDREQKIINEHFYEGKTLEQIGLEEDPQASKQAINQIESKALKKLREILES